MVTETELQDAREAVSERLEMKRESDRRRLVTAAAAAAFVVAAAGATAFQTMSEDTDTAPPAGPGPTSSGDPVGAFLTGKAPTPELVQGVWREDNGGTVLLFRSDGTVHVDVRGSIFSDPVLKGTYAIDGDTITVTAGSGEGSGCSGTGFVLRASLPQPGSMRSVRTDEARGCDPLEERPEVWEQVLPPSTGISSMTFSNETGWSPLSDEAKLHGDWMAESDGHVLEIAPDGTYSVADDRVELIDMGTWAFRDSALTLTSSNQSVLCDEGDRLVLEGVELVDPGTPGIRGTVAQNDCGGSWTPKAWIRIPSESDFP